jgi:predicted aminopeptidase
MDTSKPPLYTARTSHSGDDYARTSLPLETVMVFNDKPLYQTFIKPAMDKINAVILEEQAHQKTQAATASMVVKS